MNYIEIYVFSAYSCNHNDGYLSACKLHVSETENTVHSGKPVSEGCDIYSSCYHDIPPYVADV